MSKMSRREFLKGMLATGALVPLSSLSACSSAGTEGSTAAPETISESLIAKTIQSDVVMIVGGVVDTMTQELTDAGYPVFFEINVVQLAIDETGKVTGAIAQSGSGDGSGHQIDTGGDYAESVVPGNSIGRCVTFGKMIGEACYDASKNRPGHPQTGYPGQFLTYPLIFRDQLTAHCHPGDTAGGAGKQCQIPVAAFHFLDICRHQYFQKRHLISKYIPVRIGKDHGVAL